MTKRILQKEALVLRKMAEEIPQNEIISPKIQSILEEMKTALASQDDGVAIAAPQIGYALRIFVVSGKVESISKKIRNKNEDLEKRTVNFPDQVYINPVIKKLSKEKKLMEEGCLSVRFLYGKVTRSNKASVVAYDENGKKFTRGGTGLVAQIFQHEVDHLNGILFTDKAKEIEEMIPEHMKRDAIVK
ncbi:peptide deformylase [Patescibacteria group bacterium]|nr:peptide deformylase [Patescibacteria group bacterium]